MTQELKDAYSIVSQVCANFTGNLETHGKIQAALSAIHNELEREKDEDQSVPYSDPMRGPD